MIPSHARLNGFVAESSARVSSVSTASRRQVDCPRRCRRQHLLIWRVIANRVLVMGITYSRNERKETLRATRDGRRYFIKDGVARRITGATCSTSSADCGFFEYL
jgi:hypothetical protein